MLLLHRCCARGSPPLSCPSKSGGEEGKLAARSPGLAVKNFQDGAASLPSPDSAVQTPGRSISYRSHMTSIILISRRLSRASNVGFESCFCVFKPGVSNADGEEPFPLAAPR